MFSFFTNYKYNADFFLPIPWVERLRPEIDQKKINRKNVSKKINRILDKTLDQKRISKICVNYISKHYVAISVYTQDIDLLDKLKKNLKTTLTYTLFGLLSLNLLEEDLLGIKVFKRFMPKMLGFLLGSV